MKSLLKKFVIPLSVILIIGIWLAFTHFEKPMQTTNFKSETAPPEELGKVHWLRSMADAQARAVREGKPILILFQEVPGCSTCRRYGNAALSHPLIVEAIETLFVPLAIYNNEQGEDARVLQYFNEPAWNNPVVRIVNAEKTDLTKRLSGDYSSYGLVSTMLKGLNLSNRVVPRYLELLGEEMQAQLTGTEKVTLAMSCFWTGEKELGMLPGVVSTEPGFMDGREVVQVDYNPSLLSFEKLLREAEKSGCAGHVYTIGPEQQQVAGQVVGKAAISPAEIFKPDKEPKYFLSRMHWKYLPMTALQATRANSLVGKGKSPDELFSPRQLELAAFIEKNQKQGWENVIEKEFTSAWQGVYQKYKPMVKG